MPRYPSSSTQLAAEVMLIAITVFAAVVVAGVFMNVSDVASRRAAAVVDHVRLVASPAGGGTWAIAVKNLGTVSITAIRVDWPDGSTCATSISFRPVPLSPGGTAAGSGSVAGGCVLGVMHGVVLKVFFEDGSEQVLVVKAAASTA
ncbi:MAG: hypothetical protein QXH12_05805 [Candidatus Caldarchaeum sp.]